MKVYKIVIQDKEQNTHLVEAWKEPEELARVAKTRGWYRAYCPFEVVPSHPFLIINPWEKTCICQKCGVEGKVLDINETLDYKDLGLSKAMQAIRSKRAKRILEQRRTPRTSEDLEEYGTVLGETTTIGEEIAKIITKLRGGMRDEERV